MSDSNRVIEENFQFDAMHTKLGLDTRERCKGKDKGCLYVEFDYSRETLTGSSISFFCNFMGNNGIERKTLIGPVSLHKSVQLHKSKIVRVKKNRGFERIRFYCA